MSDHANLFYLFQEDMQRYPLPEEKDFCIRKNLEKFYKKIKPPWISLPPNTVSKEPKNKIQGENNYEKESNF